MKRFDYEYFNNGSYTREYPLAIYSTIDKEKNILTKALNRLSKEKNDHARKTSDEQGEPSGKL